MKARIIICLWWIIDFIHCGLHDKKEGFVQTDLLSQTDPSAEDDLTCQATSRLLRFPLKGTQYVTDRKTLVTFTHSRNLSIVQTLVEPLLRLIFVHETYFLLKSFFCHKLIFKLLTVVLLCNSS